MNDLEVVKLYENLGEDSIDEFFKNAESRLHVQTDMEKITEDTEWIEMIEGTIQYIDNIFRNPNRFIVNEEEIVKIELARKITVESIKHLSKNTNLIQDIDKKTGDVKPSKILNINKEESYDTYENRLIYTLVQNVKFFVSKKKKLIESRMNVAEKSDRSIEYSAKSKYKNEIINIDVTLNSGLDNGENAPNDSALLMERIKKLEEKIIDVCSNDVYKIIDKKHIALVTPPIKKTNLILKNVNFQYAMTLWTYLQDHLDDSTKHVSEKGESDDDENTKRMMDETFLLDYLITRSLTEEPESESLEEKEELRNDLTNGLLQRIVTLNPDMGIEDFKQMIGDKFEVIKMKNVVSFNELQNIFKQNIDKYLEKLK